MSFSLNNMLMFIKSSALNTQTTIYQWCSAILHRYLVKKRLRGPLDAHCLNRVFSKTYLAVFLAKSEKIPWLNWCTMKFDMYLCNPLNKISDCFCTTALQIWSISFLVLCQISRFFLESICLISYYFFKFLFFFRPF